MTKQDYSCSKIMNTIKALSLLVFLAPVGVGHTQPDKQRYKPATEALMLVVVVKHNGRGSVNVYQARGEEDCKASAEELVNRITSKPEAFSHIELLEVYCANVSSAIGVGTFN